MKNGNTPAFSKSAFYHPDGGIDSPNEGLTKREYFAGLAMQGILSNEKQSKHKSNIIERFLQLFFPKLPLSWSNSNYDCVSKDAMAFADELLKQLEDGK